MLHPWKYITISGKLWTRKDSLEKQKWQNVEKEDFKKKIFSTTMLLNEKSVKIFRKILRYSLQKMKITTIATITMEKETTMKFTLAVSKKLFGLFGPRVWSVRWCPFLDYDNEFDQIYPDYEDYDTPGNGIQVRIRVTRTPPDETRENSGCLIFLFIYFYPFRSNLMNGWSGHHLLK